MNVHDIAQFEAEFESTGIDSQGKFHSIRHQTTNIPGESGKLRYVQVQPLSGDRSYYYKTEVAKDQIVLHFTAGYLKGDVATLTTHDTHVSVPFIIGRNGGIYNLFSSRYWANHLGKGAVGGNYNRSKASVAIELSNIGPLIPDGDKLTTIYSPDDVYCLKSETEFYVQKTFRGFHFFATFTDAQYRSLITLLRYLTAKFDIPRAILPVDKRYQTSQETPNFRGIVSHVNYRSSGKWDFGPALDWNRIIRGLED